MLEEQEEIVYSASRHSKTQKSSVSTPGACKAGGGLAVEQASSLGQGSKEAVAAPLNRTDRDAPSSPDIRRFNSAELSRPTAQEREQEQKSSLRTSKTLQESWKPPSTSCSSSLLKDLIGDASILDDLLKPKSRNSQPSSKSKTAPASSVPLNPNLITSSSPKLTSCSDSSSKTPTTSLVQTSKKARKDIWDILSEGNEESINRLTDPEEVQKVCINSSFLARDFSGHKDSTNLWKTNDKFLWKK